MISPCQSQCGKQFSWPAYMGVVPFLLHFFCLEYIRDISWLNKREIVQFICFIWIFGATVHILIEILWTLVRIFKRSKRTPQEVCPICLEIIEQRCTLKCTHQFCYPCYTVGFYRGRKFGSTAVLPASA